MKVTFSFYGANDIETVILEKLCQNSCPKECVVNFTHGKNDPIKEHLPGEDEIQVVIIIIVTFEEMGHSEREDLLDDLYLHVATEFDTNLLSGRIFATYR